MAGIDKAREEADKLKKDILDEDFKEKVVMEQVKNELATIANNPELVKLYNDNARVGSENLGSDLPQLKIHATGKSTTNTLADGTEPTDGYFFYKPSQQQFKEVVVHILTISRGFRAEGMSGQKDVFNQILSGVIINEGDQRPFIMYFTGTKLQNLWNFGKEAGKYTHARPVAIPLFALLVKMNTQKVETTYGKSWVVSFSIMKNEADDPIVITDIGEFQFLRDMVDMMNETIEKVIAAKVLEEPEVVKEIKVE